MGHADAIPVLNELWAPGRGVFWRLEQGAFDAAECERAQQALAELPAYQGDFVPRRAVSLLWGIPSLLETQRAELRDSGADMLEYLRAAQGLTGEVERILGRPGDGDDAIETQRGRARPAASHPLAPGAAEQLGFEARFRILRELARGGMGRVLLAEDTVLRREVAVKEMLGDESQEALQRFEREVLLTARLQHPNIVSVHELSHRPSGGPCLVMRRVLGKPFNRVIDEADTLEKRLRLLGPFIAVCDAVAYTHGQRVIHRDLKPGNVLIGEFGDTVLIDWGLAKDLRAPPEELRPPRPAETKESGAPGAGGELTVAGQVMGTPEYMAPEQARGEESDERTDVYALGTILYQLLCGELPYRRAKGSDGGDVIDAVIAGPPDSLAARAEGLAPELVTLVERAMARDANERFANAGELAEELKRFQAGGLVRAHAYSMRELLSRWARRNAATLLVSAAFVALLVVLATLGLRRIVAERDRANNEAEASNRVANFLAGMFAVSSPSEARGNSVTAREVLDRAAGQIDSGLSNEPAIQARLMSVMGGVYEDLGLYPRAEELYRKALATWRRVRGDHGVETAKEMSNLGSLIYQEGRYSEAEPLMREALETMRRSLGPDSRYALAALGNLANLEDDQGHYAEAERLMRESIERRARVFGDDDPDTIVSRGNLAYALEHEGRSDEAIALLRETFASEQRVLGDDNPNTLESLNGLATMLEQQGKYAEAEQIESKSLEIKRKVDGPEHPDTLIALANLAGIYEDEGRFAEAEKLLRETLAIDRRVLGPAHPDTLGASSMLADALAGLKRLPEAEALQQATLAQREQVLGAENPATLRSLVSLGGIYRDEGRLDEAERLFQRALSARRRVLGPDHRDTAASLYQLAGVSALRGDKEKAMAYLLEASAHGLPRRLAQGLGTDPELKPLAGDPRFEAWVATARASR